MIPEDHPLTQIKKNIDFSFVENEVASLYHPEVGRPSFPPEVLFRVLFLEVWSNLSDLQVCRELKYNVLYRWFCDIGWDDPVPDDTTLVVFRRRLGERAFKGLFKRVVEQAREKKCLRGKWALVDGTKVVAHTAVKSHLTLAREGRKKLFKALEREDPDAAKKLAPLARPEKDSDYADHRQLLAAEKEKGRMFLAALPDCGRKRLRQLKEMCGQFIEGKASATPKPAGGLRRRVSPFLGYKVHAAADETGIVTVVTVTPGNAAELGQVKPLLAELQEQGLKPYYLAADKGYDTSELRHAMVADGIKPYIACRYDLKRLSRAGFHYDHKKKTMGCPGGKTALGASPLRGGLLFYFSETDCKECPRRSSCLKPWEKHRRVYFKEDLLRNRPQGLKRALRLRKGIERVFGDAKVWHRLERARYRGKERVTIQVLLTFMVTNVKKMVKRITSSISRGEVSPSTA